MMQNRSGLRSGARTRREAPGEEVWVVVADWDMSSYFEAPDASDYRAFRKTLSADLEALLRDVADAGPLEAGSVDHWARLITRMEDANARSGHLSSYLGCLGAADARDGTVKRETASVAAERAQMGKLFVAVRARLGAASETAFGALQDHEATRPVAYFLGRLRERASHSMDEALEGLASELEVTGMGAFGRLYDQLSGALEFDLEVAPDARGESARSERLPVSMTRSLLEDADSRVREAALRGANLAWEGQSEVVAACLNAIAGTRLTLQRRRGESHYLDPALFDAGIRRETLEALMTAIRDRQEVLRRFMRDSARLLGKERLAWSDLMAPLPSAEAPPGRPWTDAVERVCGAFSRVYPDLGDFAREAIDRRWIDHTPRTGKRPGGFCSSSSVSDESRIFMTYGETLGDQFTLAHELGHAWHSRVMKGMRPFARRYPMTLAETASTFAEEVVAESVLSEPATSRAERLAMLYSRLQDGVAYLLDIPTRFDFECAFYEERAEGEVGASRLCELMCDAQRRNFGDALDPDGLNPWFWASKLHFYITSISFYNFPYSFGYLFALGLFSRARKEGAGFLPRYEALLRRTGSATAEEVAFESIGVQLSEPGFWHESIDLIEADLARFEAEIG